MSNEDIKSGLEVVGDFLATLKGQKKVDPATLDAVQQLFTSSKLTKAQLLRSLESRRAAAMAKVSDGLGSAS